MNCSRLGGYIALILMMQTPVASYPQQQNQSSRASSSQEQIATPRLDSYQILDYARRLADDARGLEPREAEIEFQARLANYVWPVDQSLGERLLLRSFELAIAVLKESSDASESASAAADTQTLFTQISSIAAKHNSKLEKQLLERWKEATASLGDKAEKFKQNPTQLSALLLSQSASYLRSDEPKARQLFRQSVLLRVLQDHCFFLISQRKHAAALADVLFSDALDVLAQRPLSEANEILWFSSYLFSPDESVANVAISGYNAANVAGNTSAVPKNPALAKHYLALLFTKFNASETVPPAVAYLALKNLVPQYQLLAPELLDGVYAKMGSLAPNVAANDTAMFEDARKSFNASESEAAADWERRLQNASKIENDDRRDLEYFMILHSYLLSKNDFAKAAVILTHFSNQELKQQLTDYVTFRLLQAKLEKAEVASATLEADCTKIKNPLIRVVALSSLGHAFARQKATGDALRLFSQASADTKLIKDDQDRVQTRLMLVQLYLNADPSLAFESAATAFKEINQFPDFSLRASVLSLKFGIQGFKYQLEINSPFTPSLSSTVARMCHVNCAETFQTCRLLDKREVRLWASFEAVRTALLERDTQPKSSLP